MGGIQTIAANKKRSRGLIGEGRLPFALLSGSNHEDPPDLCVKTSDCPARPSNSRKVKMTRFALPSLCFLIGIPMLETVAVAEPPSDPETTSLFNGKDLTGWHVDVPHLDENPDAEGDIHRARRHARESRPTRRPSDHRREVRELSPRGRIPFRRPSPATAVCWSTHPRRERCTRCSPNRSRCR